MFQVIVNSTLVVVIRSLAVLSDFSQRQSTSTDCLVWSDIIKGGNRASTFYNKQFILFIAFNKIECWYNQQRKVLSVQK